MTKPDPKLYVDREQTYVKHFVLESYLQKLIYKVGRWGGTLNYIDGFAGPWKSRGEKLEDTSPHIAVRVLRTTRAALVRQGLPKLVLRAMFVEADANRYEALAASLATMDDVEIAVHRGEFESCITEAVAFARSGRKPFSFTFIDPCGWTGLGLRAITPLICVDPSEVLINFMTNDINRFIMDEKAKVAPQFVDLYGDSSFRDTLRHLSGIERQERMVAEYCDRVRAAGNFKHAVSAVILNPHEERAHFHMVYCTRHDEGLKTFREIERGALGLQARIRAGLQHEARKQASPGQGFLFTQPQDLMARPYVESLHARYIDRARGQIGQMLASADAVPFDALALTAMQIPTISEQDTRDILVGAEKAGEVKFEGLGPKQRTPQWHKQHRVRSVSKAP